MRPSASTSRTSRLPRLKLRPRHTRRPARRKARPGQCLWGSAQGGRERAALCADRGQPVRSGAAASSPTPHGAGAVSAGLVSTAVGTRKAKEAAGSRLTAQWTAMHGACGHRTAHGARMPGHVASPLRPCRGRDCALDGRVRLLLAPKTPRRKVGPGKTHIWGPGPLLRNYGHL